MGGERGPEVRHRNGNENAEDAAETFLNGPAQALTPALSHSVACKDQAEIDRYRDKLLEGGKPMAQGRLTDKFGLCRRIVPEKIGEILKQLKATAAMMKW